MPDLTINPADIPTAVQWNSYMTHTGGAWNSWTPVLSQSTSPALTLQRAGYFRAGRFVEASTVFAIASGSGVANNGISITLPVTAATMPSGTPLGIGWIRNATAFYPCVVVWVSATVCAFFTTSTNTTVYAGQTGSAMSVALVTGDVISLKITYEAATG